MLGLRHGCLGVEQVLDVLCLAEEASHTHRADLRACGGMKRRIGAGSDLHACSRDHYLAIDVGAIHGGISNAVVGREGQDKTHCCGNEARHVPEQVMEDKNRG